jgi:hypothetical protein
MCSGCFGEFEENEDMAFQAAMEDGIARERAMEERCFRDDSSNVEQFEVLVGADRIIEIRWIGCRNSAFPATEAGNRKFERPPGNEMFRQYGAESAKIYRTSFTQCPRHPARAHGNGKWLLLMGLTLFSLAGLAIWFLVA